MVALHVKEGLECETSRSAGTRRHPANAHLARLAPQTIQRSSRHVLGSAIFERSFRGRGSLLCGVLRGPIGYCPASSLLPFFYRSSGDGSRDSSRDKQFFCRMFSLNLHLRRWRFCRLHFWLALLSTRRFTLLRSAVAEQPGGVCGPSVCGEHRGASRSASSDLCASRSEVFS